MKASYYVGVDTSKGQLGWQVNNATNHPVSTGRTGNRQDVGRVGSPGPEDGGIEALPAPSSSCCISGAARDGSCLSGALLAISADGLVRFLSPNHASGQTSKAGKNTKNSLGDRQILDELKLYYRG